MALKIDGFAAKNTTAMTMPTGGVERVQSGDGDMFFDFFKQQEPADTEYLDRLMKKIDDQGARLSKSPTYDELKEYRSLIKNFVGEAVGRMYELTTQAGWDRMGRQKVYTTVRKIDRKLEEMAEKIRLGQAEQLDIVASHDAIRGMLVDLYM